MYGPTILVRTLTRANVKDRYGNAWQYHPRSDRHSKVACWGIVFDLLLACSLLQRHVEKGKVCFGINHEMRDFVHDRKKKLDLVLCTPSSAAGKRRRSFDLSRLARDYEIELTPEEGAQLAALPRLIEAPVGSVLAALEAKACMTAHQRALPRLYDELNSSHQTVHGATDQAIAAGFAMVNMAEEFLSPDQNKKNFPASPVWSNHKQPRDTRLAIGKIHQLPRRAKPSDTGYDALSIVVVQLRNDGSAVHLVQTSPSPQPGDIDHYDSMISRLSQIYATRFKEL